MSLVQSLAGWGIRASTPERLSIVVTLTDWQGTCPCRCFPAMALSARRLPSLLRVPASPVPRSQRYYEGATTSHPRVHGCLFGSLPLPTGYLRIRVRISAPESSKVPLPGQDAWPSGRPNCRSLFTWTRWDLSGLQAILPVPLLRSRTPVEPTCPRHHGHLGTAPAGWTAKASTTSDFGANPQLQHPLSYASREALPLTCKARLRPAGSPLPRGSRTHWIASRSFSSC